MTDPLSPARLQAIREHRDDLKRAVDRGNFLLEDTVADLSDLLSAYEAAQREIGDLKAFLEARGFRRCDIPACNCHSYHGGHSAARLDDIRHALDDADVSTNGRTILQAVKDLLAERDALQRQLAEKGDEIDAMLADAWWLGRRSASALPPSTATGSQLREQCDTDVARAGRGALRPLSPED